MKQAILENIESLIKQHSEKYNICIVRVSDLDNFHPYDVMTAMYILSVNLKKIEILELGRNINSALVPINDFSRDIDYYKVKALPQTYSNEIEKGIRLEYDSENSIIFFNKDGISYKFKTLYRQDGGFTKKNQEVVFEYLYNRPNQIISQNELETINEHLKMARFNQYIASLLNINDNIWIEKFFPLLDARNGFLFKPFIPASEFDDYENIKIEYQTKRRLK